MPTGSPCSPPSASVDAVTWFDEDTPATLIAAVRPDALVKGGDWPVERIVGAAGVRARGGAVLSIPFEHERSTTALVRRIAAAPRAPAAQARAGKARKRRPGR